jgi:hypothetical protein
LLKNINTLSSKNDVTFTFSWLIISKRHASTKIFLFCGPQFALWGEWGAANPLVFWSSARFNTKLFKFISNNWG